MKCLILKGFLHMWCRLILNKLCNFSLQQLVAQQITTSRKHAPKIRFFKLLKIVRIFPLFLMVFEFFIIPRTPKIAFGCPACAQRAHLQVGRRRQGLTSV